MFDSYHNNHIYQFLILRDSSIVIYGGIGQLENTEKINSSRNKILFELNILEQRKKDAINDIADLKIKKENLIKEINK